MTATPISVQAQSSSSSVWLEGGAVLWGCGEGYETTLRIRASGGRFYCLSEHQRNTWSENHPGRTIFKCESASVTLGLRSEFSGAANLLQVSDEPDRWLDFDSGTLTLSITHGLKTVRVRAKANSMIPTFGGGNPSAANLGLGGWPTGTEEGQFSRGIRWVFELQDNSGKSDRIIGSTYGGGGFGTRAPGVGVWVVVPNWRDPAQHGCSSQ